MLCLFVDFIYVMFVFLFKSASTWTITFNPSFGSFTLLELVSLVKVFFRLFRLEWIFFLLFRVWTQQVKCTTSYLLARPACLG